MGLTVIRGVDFFVNMKIKGWPSLAGAGRGHSC